ncbi:MAG: ATPase/protein kinase [Bacteroidetes bacterium GWF2_29_10]|nr:MAG: ATPase/protein kinase [Bacteroidetes bacterium GWF2_29_10]
MDKNKKESLFVNDGIEKPEMINNKAIDSYKKLNRNKELPEDEFIKGILSGNRTILGKAITLVESTLPKHHDLAQRIINSCLKHSGNSIRIGITGVPGVGKSTFIEALGKYLIKQGKKIAVLAIDPSSTISKGSILGDKTRMEELSAMQMAFIRPSPSAGSLGGVAMKTRETIVLCEAAGYDIIFIETVGVGQSEIAVHSMVDFFLLLMLGGAGDELQGIKRGIMEMADGIIINKADADNIKQATRAQAQLSNAIHYFPPSPSDWITKVDTCSAIEEKGLDNVWETIENYVSHTKNNNYFNIRRKEQSKYWMYETINSELKSLFYDNKFIKSKLKIEEERVLKEEKTPFLAAYDMINMFFNEINKKK